MVFMGDDPERRKDVEARLIEAHEAERTRIAAELHDDIGQRMAVLTMDLDALDKALPLPTTEAHTRIRALSDRTRRGWRTWASFRRSHPSAERYQRGRTSTSPSAMTAFRTACRIRWCCLCSECCRKP
jgi:Histidine kinase